MSRLRRWCCLKRLCLMEDAPSSVTELRRTMRRGDGMAGTREFRVAFLSYLSIRREV